MDGLPQRVGILVQHDKALLLPKHLGTRQKRVGEQIHALHTVLGEVHAWAGTVFYVLFALHVLGALKHQFFDGERELQRMLP